MKFNLSHPLICLLLLCSPLSIHAQQTPLISWPVNVPKMQAKTFNFLFDGQQSSLMELTSPQIHLTTSIPKFIIRSWDTPLHHSLGMMHPQSMSLRISHTLMKKDDWLPEEFTDTDALAYIAWLRAIEPQASFKLLNEGSGYPPEPGSPRILDQNFRLLKLQKTSLKNQETTIIWHVIIPIETEKLVITLECPEPLMKANRQSFLDYIFSIQTYSDSFERL